jgi:hypothetical protein
MTDFDPLPIWRRMVLDYGYVLTRWLCADCDEDAPAGASRCPRHQLVPMSEVQR